MNLCMFSGNFVKKPELKYVGEGQQVAVTNFTIAVNRKFTSRDGQSKKETTYIDCEAWDSGAETIAEYCDKGDYIIIYTSAKNDLWTDAETNKKRSRMKFRVDRFEFVPGQRKREEPAGVANNSSDNDEDGIPF
jgi:single-strand DNA-binding protein